MRCEVEKNVQDFQLQIWPLNYEIFERGHAKIDSILQICSSSRINSSTVAQNTTQQQHGANQYSAAASLKCSPARKLLVKQCFR